MTIYGNSSSYNTTDPSGPTEMIHWVDQADQIAKGVSRFSFLPPTGVVMATAMLPDEKSTVLPGDLQVRCHWDPEYKNVNEVVGATFGTLNSEIQDHEGDFEMNVVNYSLSIPDCDYEDVSPYKKIEKIPSNKGWWVVSRFNFNQSSVSSLTNHSTLNESLANGATNIVSVPLAVYDESKGYFDPFLHFSENETVLPVSRGFLGWMEWGDDGLEWGDDFKFVRIGGEDDWQYGRRVRDGMTFQLGHVWYMNDTVNYLGGPHPGSIEFQVEYSLLSGPGGTLFSTGATLYTLSSWSRSCPIQDPSTQEISLVAAEDHKNVAGCVIDMALECADRFPEDIDFQTTNETTATSEVPECLFWAFDVTMLAGDIQVDPHMLAAYAGIATRNGGLNEMFVHSDLRVAINSLAAAYVLTRELVPGTVAYEGVRASIGPGYVVLMILPLFFILPLMCCITKSPPPVPRCTWDVLVLAKDEGDIIPHRRGTDSSYPLCPEKLKFGMKTGEKSTVDSLGFGVSFGGTRSGPSPAPSASNSESGSGSWGGGGGSNMKQPPPQGQGHQRPPQHPPLVHPPSERESEKLAEKLSFDKNEYCRELHHLGERELDIPDELSFSNVSFSNETEYDLEAHSERESEKLAEKPSFNENEYSREAHHLGEREPDIPDELSFPNETEDDLEAHSLSERSLEIPEESPLPVFEQSRDPSGIYGS